MFSFLHSYSPEVWGPTVRHGLFGDHDGVRFHQWLLTAEDRRFNVLATKDSDVYNIVRDGRRPLYIDRIQGGCNISEYPYDQNLLNVYREMLGDNFMGFQMHEWFSNYGSDVYWKLGDLSPEEWTRENIDRVMREKFPGPYLFLESMTMEEMLEYGKPTTYEEYYHNITSIYKKRQKVGQLVPCDSGAIAFQFELQAGSTRLMPEVGGQIPHTRMQVCYARGMTRKEGRSFGIYYEPWGGDPFTCCTYFGLKDEWNISTDPYFPFRPGGPNGGSSRSLQKRIMLYGYLSNAEFMAEEWGMYNTFLEGTDYELSPYGIVKKNFLDFTRKYKDIGSKLAPIAAVIPADLYVLSDWDNPDTFSGFKHNSERMANAKRGIKALFMDALPMLGSNHETNRLIHSDMPDALDLLNRDDSMLGKYDYLVDLTGDGDFADKFHNTCAIQDVPMLLKKLLPCYVEGGLHWMVNERTGSGYYLTVFNHGGVTRSVADGERTLPEADASVTVTFKENVSPALLEGDGSIMKDGEMYRVSVPAGGFAFIAF